MLYNLTGDFAKTLTKSEEILVGFSVPLVIFAIFKSKFLLCKCICCILSFTTDSKLTLSFIMSYVHSIYNLLYILGIKVTYINNTKCEF